MRLFCLSATLFLGLAACSKPSDPGAGGADAPAANPSRYQESLAFLTSACIENSASEASCTCATEEVARRTPEPLLKTYIAMGTSDDPDSFVEAEMSETEAAQLADIFNIAARKCDLPTD